MTNFLFSSTDINSDNSYVLRKMLLCGSEEAYYRYRLYDGDRAFEFKRMLYQFEDIIEDLNSMLDDKGGVRVEHRVTIIRAIQDCQYLFALNHAETIADYRNLMADLTCDVCPECQGAMVVA
ncbi:hypothetical protein ACN9MF_20020 [Methylobacterium fujisawaense]|uniref:hypothetical protein n=1 Tax=Methylobacterium fujisawaense TaxID=107400 RepID=UPI003CF66A54